MKTKVFGKIAIGFCVLFLALALGIGVPDGKAATEEQIEQAITDGITWLVAQQIPADGSWPAFWESVATTALAVLKLEIRAYELEYESPFDPAYPYHQNVEDGLHYLFDASASRLLTTAVALQDHTAGATGTVDDPDSRANGLGVYAHGHDYPFDTYDTGLVLAAIAASGTPDRTVNVPGSVVHGWKYIDVAQDMVDWLAWAQADLGAGEGGWEYKATDNGAGKYPDDPDAKSIYGPDNSNSGYAVLGLAYAEAFGCTVPEWVKTELNAYIGNIQDPVDGDGNDGGSWYSEYWDPIGVNILKTGNLIFEMAFVGDTPDTQRVVDALDYLERIWGYPSGSNQPPGWDGTPAQYQAMFCAMKGLEYAGIDTFDSIDWYQDFADTIVAQQNKDEGPDYGSWQFSSGRGNPTIITEWALLTLEKVAPPPPYFRVPLCAGQHTDIGYVEVWSDDTTLYVKFFSNGDCMMETHLHVALSPETIPQTKNGNPIPGQFEYSDPHGCVNEYTYTIDLIEKGWCSGYELYIAAHAALGQEEAMTIVSGDGQTIVTQRRSGNVTGFTSVNLPAILAWEPGPNYPNDGPDDSGWETYSLWDQRLLTDLRPTGADWIWESYRVLDPLYGTTLTLQRTFDIGEPIDGNLLIACDNGYEVFLNGQSLGSDNVYGDWRTSDLKQAFVDVSGWDAVGSYPLLNHLQAGTNTLTIDAANEYFNTDDAGNPAPGTESSNPGACIFAADISYYADGETAWGDGCEGEGFPGKNWATYFTYTLAPCNGS